MNAIGTRLRIVPAAALAAALLAFTAAAFGAENRTVVPLGRSPSIGAANAPVVIVEFLDYQ